MISYKGNLLCLLVCMITLVVCIRQRYPECNVSARTCIHQFNPIRTRWFTDSGWR